MKIAWLAVALLLGLTGCTSELWRSSAYNALHDYQCLEETGKPRCDLGRMSYREYNELREQVSPE